MEKMGKMEKKGKKRGKARGAVKVAGGRPYRCPLTNLLLKSLSFTFFSFFLFFILFTCLGPVHK
jgi:hypothetical protein